MEGRVTETEAEGCSLHWLTLQMPATARVGPHWNQEPSAPEPLNDRLLLARQMRGSWIGVGELQLEPALWNGMWAQ